MHTLPVLEAVQLPQCSPSTTHQNVSVASSSSADSALPLHIESWLHDTVVLAYDALLSEPKRGLSPSDVYKALEATHKKQLAAV